jgi:cysteine-rich repeat protein
MQHKLKYIGIIGLSVVVGGAVVTTVILSVFLRGKDTTAQLRPPAPPSLSVCGNGIIELVTNSLPLVSEECDDGNLTNGDGCSSECMVEKDWICRKQISKEKGLT